MSYHPHNNTENHLKLKATFAEMESYEGEFKDSFFFKLSKNTIKSMLDTIQCPPPMGKSFILYSQREYDSALFNAKMSMQTKV